MQVLSFFFRIYAKITAVNSTGGIIALGLGAKNWSLQHCTNLFKDLCQQAFTLRKGATIPLVGPVLVAHFHSKYETQPLQKALMCAYSEDEYLFGGTRISPSLPVKVAVTSTLSAGKQVVLANYNRICDEENGEYSQFLSRLKANR